MAYLAKAATGRDGARRELWIPILLCLLALAAEFFFIFHDLVPQSARTGAAKGPPLATYLSGVHQVRHKLAGTITWNSPDASSALYRDDSIATMADSTARIEFNDHSEIEIEPDSLIVLEEAPAKEAAAKGKIVARLIRGSITRTKAGNSRLVIKLSDKADASVRIDDLRGDAIFRVTRRAFGVEVVVENGAVSVNGSAPVQSLQVANVNESALNKVDIKSTQPPAPPAPKLKTPRVRIQKQSRLERIWRYLSPIPAALADEGTVEVTVDFEWEPSPGAKGYRIQISRNPDFKDIVLDQIVESERFEYSTRAPIRESELYFRVAAVGEGGALGPFSSVEKVTITPEPAPSPSPSTPLAPLPRPTPKPHRRPKVVVAPKPAPKPTPVVDHLPAVPAESPKHGFIEGSYGVSFQQCTFKSDTKPETAQGSGFVPMQLDLDYSYFVPHEDYYQVGLSVLPEKAQPDQGYSASGEEMGVPSIRFRAAKLFGWGTRYFGLGPYLTTTSQIQYTAASLTSTQKIVFGATFSLSADPAEAGFLFWEFEANPLLINNMGVDARLRFKKHLMRFSEERPWLSESGFFLGADASSRLSHDETGYGVTVELGYVW